MNKKLQLAEEFLKEGKIELERYEATKKETTLWQACEKGWATVAQALKVVNPKIRRHADFGKTAANLAEEYNNEKIVYGEACGETLHRSGFYENALDVIAVKHHLKSVEDFLKFIDNILSNGKGSTRPCCDIEGLTEDKGDIKKMKKILCLLILGMVLGIGSVARADTPVSGVITTNATWTLTESPYIVTGDVYVKGTGTPYFARIQKNT